MNRRNLLFGLTSLPAVEFQQIGEGTPAPAETQVISDLRESALYFRSVQYETIMEPGDEALTLHSWACGFIAHPASRSTYRKFPNLLDDGEVAFTIPGLPTMITQSMERTPDLFGEDAVICAVTDTYGANGAFAICLNGVLVQLLCLEPASGLAEQESIDAVRTIATAIQQRDPGFYGRGTMNRQILFDHVASTDDVREAFSQVRVRDDRYSFTQGDGISDFWE